MLLGPTPLFTFILAIKTSVSFGVWIDQTRVASYEFKNKIGSCKKNSELTHLKIELGIDLHKLDK